MSLVLGAIMRFRGFLLLVFFLPGLSFSQETAKATFAGGCFWCMEPPFEKLKGVKSVISGFSGGEKKNPSYEEVARGETKHVESVQITYNPNIISYKKLLSLFWVNIDPTDPGGQFVDRGHQYTTAIFYHNDQQKKWAQKSKEYLEKKDIFNKSIVTRIEPFEAFYRAKDYHQDFYKRSLLTKVKYKYYRSASGRDDFLEKHWEDGVFKDFVEDEKRKWSRPSKAELKKKLTPRQYEVTQEDGTEPAFENSYWDNKEEGIYVDIVSGEPLFSSKDKYKSGTGWPSFTKPLESDHIVEKEDNTLFTTRTEVRSQRGDSHLGHVFQDGPEPTGLRYCINSAALKFIPKEDLKKKGYGKYLKLFE